MKLKTIVAFLFCLSSTVANAQIGPEFRQIPKMVICGPVQVILKGLADKDINEKPLWLGKDESDKSDYAIFVNPETGAFTIVQFTQSIGCILGIGYSSQTFQLKGSL